MEVITTHINADFDCLGAMIGAKKLYPQAEMVFPGAQERSLRDFFLRSAVYAYDFKRPRDIDLDAVTRLILVDVRQSDRIGIFGELADRPNVDIHIYDHHPSGQADLKGSLEVIELVGATVTVLCHLFMERGITLNPEEATMMMLGLYEDTGNLLFGSTTIRDYQAAAYLLGRGANLNEVSDFLTQELTVEQISLLHDLIDNRTVLNIGGIEVSMSHGSTDQYVGDLAVLAHKLKDMESLEALVVAVRMGERIFMVGRSRRAEVDVGKILEEFGGGGHPSAAAAAVRDMTLVQVLEKLPMVLQKLVRPQADARDLMTTPVKQVTVDATIAEVRGLLTRYNLNAMPVMDKGRVVGIITRQIADKSAHHGLENLPVAEFMNSDFSTVDPKASIENLQRLIVEENQRMVPVIENDHLIGAITRTDLLRHLVSGSDAELGAEGGMAAGRKGPTPKKRHLARLIQNQLPKDISRMLRTMGEVGDDLGVAIFAVGGFVRDLLLHQENLDIDIVVEGDGIAFAAEFARRIGCRIRSHRKFGTAVIVFPDEFKVDVASTRMEYYLEPGALPTVEHASIRLDLYRRDFTINTLALALNRPRFGELLDYFGGQKDLREKAVRVLHNLSFIEDPTRVFRAIRFEQRLGFQIGQQTLHLLRSAIRMGFLDKVGGPRVLNELIIIFKETDPIPAIARMADLDLLKYIHPALTWTQQDRLHFEGARQALHWYDLLFTGEPCHRWLVYFLCLVTELDRDALVGIADRLGVSPRFRSVLAEERDEGHRVLQMMARRTGRDRELRPSELYGWLNHLSTEILLYLLGISGEEEVKRLISRYFTHLKAVSIVLNGNDLERLGLRPGPLFKKILKGLLAARLDGKVVSRDDEIAWVRKQYLS